MVDRIYSLLNQNAIFVVFLNVLAMRFVASSLPPRYHLWFRIGTRVKAYFHKNGWNQIPI